MATPTTLPSSFSAGGVLTASQMNNLRGAFRILQVVSATTTTVVANSSTTFQDTTLTASITPSSTSSKILVYVSQRVYADAASMGANIKIQRNGTDLVTGINIGFGGASGLHYYPGIWMDSPSSTSALTYKTVANRSTGGGTMYMQPDSGTSSIILLEVSA